MQLASAFFANEAHVVDDLLNVTGGGWVRTYVAAGSTTFLCYCVALLPAGGDDYFKMCTLHIDAEGPSGQKWQPAFSGQFKVAGPMPSIAAPLILPIEPSGGRHIYTFRLEGHAENILVPLEILLAPPEGG